MLHRLFRLTPMETEIALLVDGLTLDEAAAATGITKNTARAHLRGIFAKTGATRQAVLEDAAQQRRVDGIAEATAAAGRLPADAPTRSAGRDRRRGNWRLPAPCHTSSDMRKSLTLLMKFPNIWAIW